MRRSSLAVTGSVLLAGWMSTGVVFAQSQKPTYADPAQKGGSRSERSAETDVTPQKESPATGTVEQGRTGSIESGASQSRGDAGMANRNPRPSIGGTQSERERESGTPLPAGGAQAGPAKMGVGQTSTSDIRQAQQALKDKGHDPGPIDGVMGSRTKEAIKSFQSASNLQVTGTLDAETARKLGVSAGSSAMRSPSNLPSERNSMRSRGNMPSDANKTTRGYDEK